MCLSLNLMAVTQSMMGAIMLPLSIKAMFSDRLVGGSESLCDKKQLTANA